MIKFVFRYVVYLFGMTSTQSKLNVVNVVVRAALTNLLTFYPVKKVPVYDQHLLKPPTDPSLIKVT